MKKIGAEGHRERRGPAGTGRDARAAGAEPGDQDSPVEGKARMARLSSPAAAPVLGCVTRAAGTEGGRAGELLHVVCTPGIGL